MVFLNLIDHGNYAGLPPTGVFIFWIVASLAGLMGYGVYYTFGPGGKILKMRLENTLECTNSASLTVTKEGQL